MTHGGDSILMDSSIGCDPGVMSLFSFLLDTLSDLEDTECNIEKTIFSNSLTNNKSKMNIKKKKKEK